MGGLLRILCAAICFSPIFLAAAPAGESFQKYPRIYTYMDLAECLEDFRDREFFEFVYKFAEIERTPQLMFMTGLLYHYGLGVERDCAKAAVWYRRASEAGYSFRHLGQEADDGLRMVRDDASCGASERRARKTKIETSAADGDAEAMRRAAMQFYYGICAPLDYGRSEDWEKRAAAQDRIEAMGNSLRSALQAASEAAATAAVSDGCENAETQETGGAAVRKPQSLSEYAGEIFLEGMRHYEGDAGQTDYFSAALRFSEAAEFGIEEPMCYFLLADIQEHGRCGEPNMYGAGKNYRIASELGHAESMFRLASLHEEGKGVRRSRKEAAKWYSAAAEKGMDGALEGLRRVERHADDGGKEDWETSPTFRQILLDAQFRAFFNHSPYLLPDEMRRATQWLFKAADNGHLYAMYLTGMVYLDGSDVSGVSRDPEKADFFLRRAADGGIKEAAEALQKFRSGKR